MARSKSSRRWLSEHFDDAFVKSSRAEGYRSRASFKLLELDGKDQLFRSGQTVVDLGAAPGGWSQVAIERVGDTGTVLALDMLPMEPIAGVTFVKGDFCEQAVFEALLTAMEGQGADLVISDMAPNMSGITDIDQPASMYLAELALDLAREVLKPKGVFVAKVFQGEGIDAFTNGCRPDFDTVVMRKPRASRARSREIYMVAKHFRRRR